MIPWIEFAWNELPKHLIISPKTQVIQFDENILIMANEDYPPMQYIKDEGIWKEIKFNPGSFKITQVTTV